MDDDGGKRPGDLYRTDGDGFTEKVLEGIHIPNTIACSPDGDRLYVADSRLQTIFVHDMDPRTGALSNRREFASTRGEDCAPDGSAVDVEGCLWNAQWGAWRIVRYAPTPDPAAAKAWLGLFEQRFDILLLRTIRVRNVITHGGITVPAVVGSVVRFVAALEPLVLGAR